MMIMENTDIKDIARQFHIDGDFIEARPHGSGHINDTYLGSYKTSRGAKRFVHQRINHNVFKQPEKLMENIERVTGYARQRIIEAGGDPERLGVPLPRSRAGLTPIILPPVPVELYRTLARLCEKRGRIDQAVVGALPPEPAKHLFVPPVCPPNTPRGIS